jgi:hypothetical protein
MRIDVYRKKGQSTNRTSRLPAFNLRYGFSASNSSNRPFMINVRVRFKS